MKINYYSVVFVLIGFVAVIFGDLAAAAPRNIETLENKSANVISENNLDALLPYLNDKDHMKVRLAIWRMTTISDKRVPNILLTLWDEDKKRKYIYDQSILSDPIIKLTIAEGLIYYGVGNQVDYNHYIWDQIRNTNVKIRAIAASSLGSVGNEKAVDELMLLISKDKLIVAWNAISALKKIILENKSGKSKAIQYLNQISNNAGSTLQPILEAELNKTYKFVKKAESTENNYKQKAGAVKLTDNFSKGEFLFLSGKNHLKALELLKPYAVQGNPNAQYYVGEIYSIGIGVKHDVKKAAKWLSLSANQGNAAAQFALANIYISGDGVNKDYDEAIMWLLKSADQGYSNAQKLLSEAYQEGWWGLSQDPVKAEYWLKKSRSP